MIRPSSKRDVAERTSLTPAQWQIYEAGWDDAARFRVAVCGRRFGKALALDTPLPSPDGWISMGAVRDGTRLYDEAGSPCRVMFATEVMLGRPCFRLRFDDGEGIVADHDHHWMVSLGTDGAAETLLTTGKLLAAMAKGTICHVRCCRPLRDGATRDRRRLMHLLRHHGRRLGTGWIIGGVNRVSNEEIIGTCRRMGSAPRRVTTDEGEKIFVVLRRSERRRRIVRIEAVESVPVRCIQVDSVSRLFLCGEGMVPTHNTFLMAEELRRASSLAVRRGISPENEIWYGAPTFLQAKRVMWSRLKRTIPNHWLRTKPNETECSLRLLSGHVVRLVGLDAAENLRGSGLWFFGGDEWAD